jgi:hypothetical protein
MNEAQQTYTVPKKGLDCALSARICSLSLNVVEDCREMTTGSFHALLLPAAARTRVVGARHGDPLEPAEGLGRPAVEVRGEVRVVQAVAVAPREVSIGVGLGPERHGRVTIRKAVLVVVGHGPD